MDQPFATGGWIGGPSLAKLRVGEVVIPPVDRTRPEPGSEGPKPTPDQPRVPPPPIGQAKVPAPVVTVAQVITACEAMGGLVEQPDGSNCVPGVTDWWGLGCVPWCAEWVSVVMIKAGFGSWETERLVMPGVWTRYPWGSAYVPDWEQAFRDGGLFITDPAGFLPGDVVIFDWDGDGWGDHIGILLEDLGDGTCLVWEGNADNASKIKRRDYRDITGVGRPPYSDQEDDMFTDDDRRKLDFVNDYVHGRLKPNGSDDTERFTGQVVGELVGAVDQAGDGNRGLGWRRFVATLKGKKRPTA